MEQSFLNAIEKNLNPVPVFRMRFREDAWKPLNFAGEREVVCDWVVLLRPKGVFDGQTPVRTER